MQDIFFDALNDGVAGIIPALAAHYDVGLSGQDIDDFALAFIAPLRTDQYRICHRVAGGKEVAGDLHRAFAATAPER